MPTFEKSPAPLVERFASITADVPDAEHRQMFGYPGLFVGGNLVSGLFADGWFVRLPPEVASELVDLGGTPFAPMPGRTMTGYTVMPAAIVGDDPAVRRWVDHAMAFGRTLPPKVRKPASRSATKPSAPRG